MKVGIISDIHGNYPALLAVMEQLDKLACDKIFCLGDTCGYYCMVNESLMLLKQRGVITLKGNHDAYLLGEGKCPRSCTVNDCIEFQQKIITEENLSWLKTLSPMLMHEKFQAVHGGWNDPLDEYITTFDFAKAGEIAPECNLFLSGHTHVPTKQKYNGTTYCNPGAVGQPRDGDPRAGYAVLEDGEITLARVEYDIDWIAGEMKAAGFNTYYYRNLYFGCKIGDDPQSVKQRGIETNA